MPAQTAKPKRAAAKPAESRLAAAEVARVAYELFLERGGEHGHDQEDWLRAEAIVRARTTGPGR